MKYLAIGVVVAVAMLVQGWPGRAVIAAESFPKEPAVLAQRLVDDVKHNRPAQGLELMGRDDVLAELKKITAPLSQDEQSRVLDAVLCIGMVKDQHRWVFSEAVTAYCVEVAVSAKEAELRNHSVDLLVKYVPSSYVAVHAEALIKATKEGKVLNSLLLGKTGAVAAKPLLEKGGKVWSVDETAARAATAKLGDADESKRFVDAYQQEKDPDKKADLAKVLGYIGDATCVKALAEDMRTSIVYTNGGVRQSTFAYLQPRP
jgi:HEAT repeat protein